MKTFEERFTAWVDGQLVGEELVAFERELEAHPEALQERDEVLKLQRFLRTHPPTSPFSNADFFNLQLQERIAAEDRQVRRPERQRAIFWRLPRLAWAGACSLGIAALLYKTMVPETVAPQQEPYFAQVVEAWPADPGISATTVYNPQDNVTVLWLEGLEPLPASYQLQ